MPEQRGALATAVESFIERLNISQRVHDGTENVANDMTQSVRRMTKGRLRPKVTPETSELDMLSALDDIKIDDGIVGFFITLLAGIGLVLGSLFRLAAPVLRETEYAVDRIVNSFRLNPSDATRIGFRHPDKLNAMIDQMKDLGLSDEQITLLFDTARPTLTALDLATAWRRGTIQPQEFTDELKRQGYREKDIQTIQSVTEFLPPVQDVIRFAVRDVFNQVTVKRFSLDEDFPTGILGLGKKLGISEETLRWYWAAHWTLPSPGQALEMFQRLREGRTQHTFTSADLDRYMITADIPDFFRDRFREIAYSPLTRVDVRRMYGVGVLDRRGVLDAYMDAGYSKTNAELLTEFTIRFEGSDQIAITRGAILKSYKEGLSTRQEAVQLLEQTGHDQLAIQFWLELADHEDAVKEREEELDIIKVGFIEGVIRRDELAGQLGQLEVTGREQEILLAQWERLKRARIALPSVGELENWYKRSVVTATEYVDSMREKGFLERDINRFIRAMDDEVEDAHRKELERAQKEQERLDTAQRRNEFQVELARLDVRIAELRLSIANAKIAIHASEDPDEVEELKALILEHQASIVRLQIDKAKVRTSPP